MKKLEPKKEDVKDVIIGTVTQDTKPGSGDVLITMASGQLTVSEELVNLNSRIQDLEKLLLTKTAKIKTLEKTLEDQKRIPTPDPEEIQKLKTRIQVLENTINMVKQIREDFKPLFEKMEKEFTRTRTNGFLAILRSIWTRMNV
jgi:chromosome segregation ATPase